jgi:exodeoxyribonuclease VII large subunit
LRLAAQRNEVDALLLVRGGGSLEDLWAFNDERLVHAVAACPLPLVCGVGHETDITLCDLAADLRAPTPTAAAELAAPSRDQSLAALRTRHAALQRALDRVLQTQAQRLDTLALRLGQPARAVMGQAHKLQALAARMQRVLQHRRERATAEAPRLAERLTRALFVQLQQRRQRLAAVEQQLQAHDPSRVLQRGYAWVEALDGRPIVSVQALRPGQAVRAVWADGRADVEVLNVQPLPP